MVTNKFLIFFLFLAFGLLCSGGAAYGRRNVQDPRQQYERCQRRCQWETHGEREQEQCECGRQYKEQQGHQEKRGQHSHDLSPEDLQRKYQECRQRCEEQEHRQRPQCQQRCQRQFEVQRRQQQQCQERCEKQEQGRKDQKQCLRKCAEEQQTKQGKQPQKQYQECQERCQELQQGQQQQQRCQTKCMEQYEEQERDKDEINHHHHKESRREEEEEDEEEGQYRNNPYYFPYKRSFQTQLRDEEGKFKVLQRFAKKSPLLKGIDNYRFGILEANPNTFVLPHHSDSGAIYFATNGKGTITFVSDENKESYNVERGTVVRIPAGSTVYMVNQDNKDKLQIAMLALPVNNPSDIEEFFPAGNEKPRSYYQIFSSEILETVLNTPREKLEKLLEGQKGQQGVFRRAKPEQIRAMSQQATSPRQRGGERLVFNLLSQSAVYSNQNGRFFEASPEDFKQLQNMDVSVVAFKINQGAILMPNYNSKATFVVLVTEGNGYFEMACPHFSRQSQGSQNGRHDIREQEEEERTGEYKKVKAQLSPGDVFVLPAGHPITVVASKNENLKAIAFGINARNNERIFLAGKKNLMRQMDSEAKEISFGVPSKLVDEIFNNQEESYFVPFSQQRQRESEERRGTPLASFLDFARLF
ncbi:hypothetical protein DITRI_Ditri15bG0082200 [Diplodiscus trichospermus]